MPENRHKPNGKTISLLVAMIPSITQPPKHEPVFYITGGPGGDAMGDVGLVVPTLNQDQNLIVLGQRGTVDATPALDRKSTRLNSSHSGESRMPSSA